MRTNKNHSKLIRILLTSIFLLFCTVSFAQSTFLRGKVVDEQNQPIEFATVLFKNLDRIAFTDSAGLFVFQVPKKYASSTADLRIAVVGKKTIEQNVRINTLLQRFMLTDLSLTLSQVEINQVRKTQNSNSSIIFDRQALDQAQAFSLGDILNNLPGKKTIAPSLQSPQNITLRSEATGLQSMNNSFGVSIIMDDIQLSNNANMQNRNLSRWGMGTSEISSVPYGGFDVPFTGLDLRDIPVDNIESVEVISGVASAQYGDMTSGAIIINRQAGKTPYQFATRINGASTNFSLSKGLIIDKKWGAINYSLNYLKSNQNPSDKTKIYDRVSAGIIWTSYPFKNLKNTLSIDYSTKLDDVKMDPDDDLEIMTFSKARNLRLSNRTSIELGNSIAKRISMSIGYSNSYNESYNQRYLNGPVKGIADKNVSGEIYEGYYIPGNYLSFEHVKGQPVNINGNISLSNEFYTGKVIHHLSIGSNLYYAQNKGQGIIIDPTRPRWVNVGYQNDRPYDYEALPEIYNYGIYLQDNFKLNVFKKALTFNPGLRYDVQNAQGNLQPRVNVSYALSKDIELNGAFGISTKGPSMAHRYPSASYIDIALLNKFTGYVNESVFLVYTDKIVPDNSNLKSSQSNQLELGIKINKKRFSTSLFGYYKKDSNGFSNNMEYHTYSLPEYDYTYVQGDRPIYGQNGSFKNYYVGINTVGNTLNSSNMGIEWAFSLKKIQAIQTSVSLNNSFSYSHYKNGFVRTIPVDRGLIELGKTAWFGIYPPDEYTDWVAMTKINTTTHIPKLGFVVNLMADVTWQTVRKTLGDANQAFAYLDKNLDRFEIPSFDPTNPDYGHLLITSASNTRLSLPFPIANLSISIAKEIKKKIRFSVNAFNLLNVKTRYLNPVTNNVIEYATPTSVGAEISIKF